MASRMRFKLGFTGPVLTILKVSAVFEVSMIPEAVAVVDVISMSKFGNSGNDGRDIFCVNYEKWK